MADSNKTEIMNPTDDLDSSRELRRIDAVYLLEEISTVLNFHRGIFYTIREILLRPGKSVNHFIHRDRSRLVKPVVFIIICSLAYTVFQQFFGFEDGYINYSFEENNMINKMFEWTDQNYGYTNLFFSIFIAFYVRIFFRKHAYNFFEVLILLCYTIGMSMLLFAFFGIIDTMTSVQIVDKGFLIGIIYIAWGIGDLFEGNVFKNTLKGLLCYILGLTTFVFLVLIVGTVLEKLFM